VASSGWKAGTSSGLPPSCCWASTGRVAWSIAASKCTTKAPFGGQAAGPSPVDRRKQGLKRSIAVEADGIPLAAVPTPANHRDDGLLAATLDAITVVGPRPTRPVVHRCWL
jgi:hypothetical protein